MLIFIGWIEILFVIHFCWLFIFFNHSSLNYLFIGCFSSMRINPSDEEPITVILHILYCRLLIRSFLSLLSLWILVLIWSRDDTALAPTFVMDDRSLCIVVASWIMQLN